ncbi:MAG: hypothetical protein GX366_03495 [Epulopiscium sp.]|nr:hypothetical protein [Candidatus Epulonipiscium sp.]
MLLIFFSLNIIVFLSTFLSLTMFHNNLKKISTSIDIYLDPKAYRPENKIRFISLLMDKYKSYDDKSAVDVDTLIKESFYCNKIGKFKTQGVETLSRRGKVLLWISIISMVIFEATTLGLGQSQVNSILIIISAGLGILLAFFEMYLDIEMGKKRLFLKIKNHINNEYPQFEISKKEREEVTLLLKKIEELESEIYDYKNQYCSNVRHAGLGEDDIIQILKQFDASQI